MTSPAGMLQPFPDPQNQSTRPAHDRLAILGVGVDNVSMAQTLTLIEEYIRIGGFHQIATANVDFLNHAALDADLMRILQTCDLVLADGMPLVWSARMLGASLRERVTGADLVPELLSLSHRKQYRIFLLGASPDRSDAAYRRIMQQFPNAVICGRLSPPIAPIESMDTQAILEQIEAADPDILFVAFGNPKQEKWIAMNRHRLQVPVCIGVGAALDFLSGEQSRAPLFMQRRGMEWLFRLASEPRRLLRRYSRNILFLSRYLSAQLIASSLQTRIDDGEVAVTQSGSTMVAHIHGGFTSRVVAEIRNHLFDASGVRSLVLDMTSTEYVGIEAAGWMARTMNEFSLRGGSLWTAGAKRRVSTALQATFPSGQPYRVAASLASALNLIGAEASASEVDPENNFRDTQRPNSSIHILDRAS